MNQSVVISGIRGFVGTNLKAYLSTYADVKISGASRDASALKEMEEELVHTLSYRQLVSDPDNASFDTYVHLAGKVYDLKDKRGPESYFKANYDLTKDLFDRFLRDKQAKKFIFLSTIHVVTEAPDRELDENYTPHPITPYGVSKLQAENYISDHCPPEKKIYILRPSMIHGPGNKGNLNLLYNLVRKGYPYPIGAFNNKRSFVSIENLCFIIKEILENDIDPGLYHVADDDPTHTHELVKLIAESLGREAKIWSINPSILITFAKIGDVIPLPINSHRLGKLTGDFVVSNQKIKQAIGKALPVSAEEGLRRTLYSFHDRASLD